MSANSLDPELSIREFKRTSEDAWRQSAEKLLKGAPLDKLTVATHEGLKIKPLYTQADRDPKAEKRNGMPGGIPFVRGNTPVSERRSWSICQKYTRFDPAVVNAEIRRDLGRGVQAVWLRADRSVRLGRGPEAVTPEQCDGVGLYTHKAVGIALDGLDLSRQGVFLDAGALSPLLAAALTRFSDVPVKDWIGVVAADPLGALAADGELPTNLNIAYDLMAGGVAKFKTAPHMAAVSVSLEAVHNAGADMATELGVFLATAVEYLRALESRGIAVKHAAEKMCAFVPVGRDGFREVAKLRAMRALWAQMLQHCGLRRPSSLRIQAMTSARTWTARDPWVNMLRGTAEVFAAGMGGADFVTSQSFDAALGAAGELGRRMAINTQLILQAESHLGKVADPAGGSYFLEAVTRELQALGWARFQEIERQGGVTSVLQNGWLATGIAATADVRAKDIAKRKLPVVGVSVYPNIHEAALDAVDVASEIARVQKSFKPRVAPQAVEFGKFSALRTAVGKADFPALVASQGRVAVEALPVRREAAAFEALRDVGDRLATTAGTRPKVFLANMGRIADFNARATFAKNFYEAGGLETLDNGGFPGAMEASQAFRQSGAKIAVLCSSDKVYPLVAAETAKALKAAGALRVALAGRPGEHEQAWRTAGIDTFIYVGSDVLAELKAGLKIYGVDA